MWDRDSRGEFLGGGKGYERIDRRNPGKTASSRTDLLRVRPWAKRRYRKHRRVALRSNPRWIPPGLRRNFVLRSEVNARQRRVGLEAEGSAQWKLWRPWGGGSLWKLQPQGRIRHETRPKECERNKASRGWENLKAQRSRVRQARRRSLLAFRNVVGEETPWKGGKPASLIWVLSRLILGRNWSFGSSEVSWEVSDWLTGNRGDLWGVRRFFGAFEHRRRTRGISKGSGVIGRRRGALRSIESSFRFERAVSNGWRRVVDWLTISSEIGRRSDDPANEVRETRLDCDPMASAQTLRADQGQERMRLHRTVKEHLGYWRPRRAVVRFVEGQAHGGSAEPMKR